MEIINIIKRWGLGLILCIGMVTMLNSCKDDDETLIDQFYEFPEIITCSLGDVVEIADMKFGDETLVVPAVVMNLSYAIENTDIVAKVNGELKAVGIGSTEIFIYNSDEELIKTIPVIVSFDAEFINPADGKISLKYRESIECLSNTENKDELKYCRFISSDSDIVSVDNKGLITAVGLGTANVTVYVNSQEYRTYGVTVAPNYEITMTSGQVRDLDEMIDNLPYNYKYSLYSSDSKVVNLTTGTSSANSNILTALKAGTAIIGNSVIKIEVTVEEGLTNLFDLNAIQIGHYVRLSSVKANMAGYTRTYEGAGYYNGVSYPTALTYKPFDDATSITFYFDRMDYLKIRVVETGKTSEEVCGWLVNNAEKAVVDSKGQFSYFRVMNGSSYNYIYPSNGSWSTLEIEDYWR